MSQWLFCWVKHDGRGYKKNSNVTQFYIDIFKKHTVIDVLLLPKRKTFNISSQDQSGDKRVCTCPTNNISLPGEYENLLGIQIGSGQPVHASLLTAAGQTWQTQRKQSRCAMIGIIRGDDTSRSGGNPRDPADWSGITDIGTREHEDTGESREHRNFGTPGQCWTPRSASECHRIPSCLHWNVCPMRHWMRKTNEQYSFYETEWTRPHTPL